MRSDYYDSVAVEEPLRPLAPPPGRRRRRRRALPLFLFFLIALACSSVLLFLQFGNPFFPVYEQPPFDPIDFYPDALDAPLPEKTAIRTIAPPGEGGLSLAEAAGEPLSAQEIYASLSPSILSVTALYSQGGGSEGTGILFDERGYFLTNAHVVEGKSTVSVTLENGKKYPAYLIGMDSRTDLAVLKFSALDLTAAPFGDDGGLRVGDTVYAIGNPLGSQFHGSMTDGIVSAIGRSVTVDGNDMSLIQTSAAINTGSSGGALVDSYGRVVGITNMKMMSWYSTVEGLGFAIPVSTAEKVVRDIMATGHVTGRPQLGITVRPASPEESETAGLYIEYVNPRSDAWEKGIREGDILIYANGVTLLENQDLLDQKAGLSAGDSMTLTWLSPGGGAAREAQVLLVEEYTLNAE